MTRVFIVAATPALRAGLRSMLAGAGLEVIGESASAVLAPPADVVVAAGDEAPIAARVLARAEGAALVALSNDPALAGQLGDLPLRGWAIVMADASAEELAAAVAAAAQGLAALPRAWAERLNHPRPAALADPPADPLTARELEVLALLSEGLPNKQIAGRLQISEHTVKFHIASIFGKLGAASRTEAVSIGARQGLITL